MAGGPCPLGILPTKSALLLGAATGAHLAAAGGVQEGAQPLAVTLQQLGAGQGAEVGGGGDARRRQRRLQLVACNRGA